MCLEVEWVNIPDPESRDIAGNVIKGDSYFQHLGKS